MMKKEYIYPELFFGLPTFWRFMSPTLARSTTAIILMIGIILILLALIWLIQSIWFMGILAGLLALFSLYIFVRCIKSIGKCQIKEFSKCNACGLEWSGPKGNAQWLWQKPRLCVGGYHLTIAEHFIILGGGNYSAFAGGRWPKWWPITDSHSGYKDSPMFQ